MQMRKDPPLGDSQSEQTATCCLAKPRYMSDRYGCGLEQCSGWLLEIRVITAARAPEWMTQNDDTSCHTMVYTMGEAETTGAYNGRSHTR